ncbi:TonB-dependent receptor [Hyphomicrobium sulfonivorans]|uniref:TonB-dependent receptor n=1 Tax=Hyphomicrobium sulfonivorans TaxID=121290 RepID=UPI00156F7791|nr:TonB-dependent receptor [Hyphomicrobium sulfonivorans]MBI1650568.1 TonB-dependent receptor [Hyphomicrobium sulfonivorans]NSL72073.1 TonB-dependent receptor [Hyphomicrobium sulfonivorans]
MRCGGNGRRAEACRAGVAASWLAICACVGAIGVAPELAFAQAAQKKSFNIPAGSLAQALAAFGKQAGQQVSYPSELTAGKTSAGVSGSLTASEALSAILAGSGLSYSFANASTVSISGADSGAGATVDGAIALDTIDVSGGGATDGFSADTPYYTAGSSTYISGEQIERFRGTSTGDMFSGTPGVLNGDNRNGAALDINIRGMQGQGRVPVSVDGAIQETTVYRGYSGVVGRSYVDPDFIGSVTIEKGPSAAADGAGAIGGIVRMDTIGVDDILLPGKNSGVRFKGGFNTNSSSVPAVGTWGGLAGTGNYPNSQIPSSFGGPDGMDRPGLLEPTGGYGSVAAAYRSETIDIVAAYAQRKNGNYHAGTKGDGIPEPTIRPRQIWQNGAWVDSPTESTVTIEGLNRFRPGEEVLNTSQDNSSILLKSTIRIADDQQIELGYMGYDSTYGEIMPSQLLWNPNGGAYQAWLNSVELKTYTAKYKWNPADNDLIKLKAGWWMVENSLTLPYQWYMTDQTPMPEIANWFGTDGRRWGLNADNTSTFDSGLGHVSLNYGGSYTYETIQPGKGTELDGRRGNRQEYSLFASGEWKPTRWLGLNASLRYSDFINKDTRPWTETTYPLRHGDQVINFKTSAERTAYRQANPGSTNLPTVSETKYGVYRAFKDNGFAPILSATVEPWEGIQFYAKYAEAIRMPSLFEATRGWSADPTAAGLDPEHAKTWEFGFNVLRDEVFFAGDRLRFKASYFDNDVDNYITRTDTPEGTLLMVNIDSARLRGIELSGSYDTGRFFGNMAYTYYTSTEFCVKPGQIRNVAYADRLCTEGGVSNSYVVNHLPPKDSISVTLGTRAFDEKLTVGGRITYIGKRPTSGLDGTSGTGLITHVEWDPYTLVDLFASYKINEQFQIDATIDNVTDTYYMDALTLGLMASPGRTIRTGITARF